MHRLVGAVAPVVLCLLGAAEAAAPRDPIVPHRAVYAIGLARTDEGSGVTTAEGRMVFEITGGACQGYNMRQRMVVNIGDEEGNVGLLDFRIATFESADGGVYDFDARTKLNKDVIEAVQGQARRLPAGIEVTLKEPSEKVVKLDGNTLFPSQHLRAILDAALAKQKFVAAEIYEGAGDGEESDSASAAIGKAVLGGPGDPLRGGVRHWPVSVGYFGGRRKGTRTSGRRSPPIRCASRCMRTASPTTL
jgi:hypothetical protein